MHKANMHALMDGEAGFCSADIMLVSAVDLDLQLYYITSITSATQFHLSKYIGIYLDEKCYQPAIKCDDNFHLIWVVFEILT